MLGLGRGGGGSMLSLAPPIPLPLHHPAPPLCGTPDIRDRDPSHAVASAPAIPVRSNGRVAAGATEASLGASTSYVCCYYICLPQGTGHCGRVPPLLWRVFVSSISGRLPPIPMSLSSVPMPTTPFFYLLLGHYQKQ